MIESLDQYLFHVINRGTENPLFDVLMPLLTDRGYLLALPVSALALITLFHRREPIASRTILINVLLLSAPFALFFLADSVNDLIKSAIARPRPCHALEGVRLLTRCPRSYSMPSGHAIASFAFATSFAMNSRNLITAGWKWYLLALAGIIAFSRVYIGVHYPSDILAGTALGAGLGWGLCIPLLRFSERFTGAVKGSS